MFCVRTNDIQLMRIQSALTMTSNAFSLYSALELSYNPVEVNNLYISSTLGFLNIESKKTEAISIYCSVELDI